MDKQAFLQALGKAFPEYLNTPIVCGYHIKGDVIKVLNCYLYKLNIKTYSSMPYTEFKVIDITENYYRVVPKQTVFIGDSNITPNQGSYLISRHHRLE